MTVFSKKEMDEIEKINEEKSNVTKFENKTSNLINTVCNEFNSDKVIPKSLRDKEELLNYI
ncbi:MAG: hypothetical protein P1U46_02625 [Patescibacteria group bacterium]|nr:hypothetical protein [Patescibacteria group bacterium]